MPVETSGVGTPDKFTYPFCYKPHPLCVAAANEVKSYIQGRTEWHDEIKGGKMFGVLVVRCNSGQDGISYGEKSILGYIAAFSGILAGQNNHEYFVPPIYDLQNPAGYFHKEESEISAISGKIELMGKSSELKMMRDRLACMERQAQEEILAMKEKVRAAKCERDRKRRQECEGNMSEPDFPNADMEAMLIKESQFMKAELRRTKAYWAEHIEAQKRLLDDYMSEMEWLRTERKQRSQRLQHWLFEQFVVCNANGERKNLTEIFDAEPPAGSGECCAPKLLQAAYLNGWQPVCMAEFWWGESPKDVVRHHGVYYPACRSKCLPILGFMMQGLDVEPNPLLGNGERQNVEIMYEDKDIVVINKPYGMLSVPGKESVNSVYSIVRKRYPDADEPMIVHRLDMDTSGLMIVAKNKAAHKKLQSQFIAHEVRKRYIAVLEGHVAERKGRINLPICADITDRPRQMVSKEFGRKSVTDFEVLAYSDNRTLIAFMPQTGRTHQLRLHSAHPDGLSCPIVGDRLYGNGADRMYLHAESITFKHPVSGEVMTITADSGFSLE
ncbi:MAG: RluA family pseudouridine synthase [Bacteroides sp.]|nr:RluA family pseudouridine synthase [Bacteroides sp.]MCM1421772.1 RluA family pseudouridine synthase [Bacteroides sp.]